MVREGQWICHVCTYQEEVPHAEPVMVRSKRGRRLQKEELFPWDTYGV